MTDLVPLPHYGEIERHTTTRSPIDVYLGSVSDGSAETLGRNLTTACRIITGRKRYDPATPHDVPWWTIPPAAWDRFRSDLIDLETRWANPLLRPPGTKAHKADWSDGLSPSVCNSIRAALRRVLEEAELMEADELGFVMPLKYRGRVNRKLKGSKNVRVSRGEIFTPTEVRKMTTHDGGAIGVRDAAIFATMNSLGLRRAEAASLTVAHVMPVLVDGGPLIITGKGSKDRSLYVPAGVRAKWKAWLDIRGDAPGGLWSRVHLVNKKAGEWRVADKPISAQSIQLVFNRRSLASGVKRRRTHMARKTAATRVYQHKGIKAAQELLGHASIVTTEGYIVGLGTEQAEAQDAIDLEYEVWLDPMEAYDD